MILKVYTRLNSEKEVSAGLKDVKWVERDPRNRSYSFRLRLRESGSPEKIVVIRGRFN